MILERLTFFRWPVEIPIFWRFSADAAMPGHCRRTGSRSDAPLLPVVVFFRRRRVKKLREAEISRILVSWHLMLTSLEEVVIFEQCWIFKKNRTQTISWVKRVFLFQKPLVFFRMLIWCGTTPGNHGDPVLSAWMRDRRVCHKGTKRLNDYSTPQSSTMTIQVPGILLFFHSFYPEFELWLSFLPETRIKTLILRKLTWLAVNSSFSIGNTSWHGGFSSLWFIAICIFNVFSTKKNRTLSICPLFYQVWHLVSFNMLVSLNFKQKDAKTLGFSIPEKNHKAQEYPWIYSCFLQLSISMGHNCPVFIRLFVARMYDSYAKGLADRPTVYESKVSRMKWCPQPIDGEDLAKDDAIREIHGHQKFEKKNTFFLGLSTFDIDSKKIRISGEWIEKNGKFVFFVHFFRELHLVALRQGSLPWLLFVMPLQPVLRCWRKWADFVD